MWSRYKVRKVHQIPIVERMWQAIAQQIAAADPELVQPLGHRTAPNHAAIGIPSSSFATVSIRAMKESIFSAGATLPMEACGRRRL